MVVVKTIQYMYTFSGIKMAKLDIATLYLALATFSGVRLYLQNCKSKSVLVASIFKTKGVMWVRPFTCSSDIYSKFVLFAGITVTVFHEGGPILDGGKWS